MRVAVYCRVSTEDQAKRGYSIPSQEEDCRRKVAEIAPGAEVTLYIDDGVSGSVMERPALDRLRADVGAGLIRHVVTLDPDRFSRDLIHLLLLSDELSKRSVVHFVNMAWERTAEGRLFLSLRGAIAEFERAKIKERTHRGKRQKVSQGRIAQAPVWLYGYRYTPGGQLDVDEAEAATVRRIFDMYLQGVGGTGLLAERLRTEGVRGPRSATGSGNWHQNTVRRILSNPAYVGRLRQFYKSGAEGNEVDVPAIVPMETWVQAQRMLLDNRKHNPGRSMSLDAPLLSGLLWCGVCGRRVYGSRGIVDARAYGYYLCSSHRKRYGLPVLERCELPRMPMARLDEAVWKSLCDEMQVSDDVWRRRMTQADDGSAAEAAQIEARLADLVAARGRITTLVVRGTLSDEEAEVALRETAREITTLRARMQVLMSGPPKDESLIEARLAYLRELRNCVGSVSQANLRRAILHRALSRITLHPTGEVDLQWKTP